MIATSYQIYPTNGELAYQVDYSDGLKLRAVEGNGTIRQEYEHDGAWLQVGESDAERMKASVINALEQLASHWSN